MLRVGFFSAYFGNASLAAFASLLLQNKGLGPLLIGAVLAVAPLTKLLIVPPLSALAETRNIQVPVLLGGIAFGTLCFGMLLWSHSVAMSIAVAVLYYVCSAHIFPFFDDYTMTVLASADRRNEWGSFRSYGAYGWAVGAVCTSLVIHYGGWPWVYAIWICGFGMLTATILGVPVRSVEVGSHGYGDVLRFVQSQPRIKTFFFGIACMGCGSSMIGSFLFPYLDHDMRPHPILYGICLVFTVSVEIPIFRHSAWLHERLSDHHMLLLAMFAFAVRATGYSLLTSPWYVLVFELLHGLTFGLSWLAGVHFFSTQFPSTQSNSAFGLLHAAVYGVGPLCGNLIGGLLYETLGARGMFQCAAAAMLAAAVLFDHLQKGHTAPGESDVVASRDVE